MRLKRNIWALYCQGENQLKVSGVWFTHLPYLLRALEGILVRIWPFDTDNP